MMKMKKYIIVLSSIIYSIIIINLHISYYIYCMILQYDSSTAMISYCKYDIPYRITVYVHSRT
jgi:hypothetical protein